MMNRSLLEEIILIADPRRASGWGAAFVDPTTWMRICKDDEVAFVWCYPARLGPHTQKTEVSPFT